jgi:hypothetical protein
VLQKCSQRATKLQQFPHKRERVVFPRPGVRRGGNERGPRDQGAGPLKYFEVFI